MKDELFDLNREKLELDSFLSSITEGKGAPDMPQWKRFEGAASGVSASGGESKIKILEDKTSTEKWEQYPFSKDNTLSQGIQSNSEKAWMKQPSRIEDIDLFDKTVRIDKTLSTFNSSVDQESENNLDHEENAEQFFPEESGSSKITWIALSIVFLIVALMAIGFLWIYPEKKNQSQQWIVSNIPFSDKILLIGDKQTNPETAKINLINVSHRFIKNTKLDRNIRVIEGMVRNNTAESIPRVKLLGELYDSEGSLLLTSKTSLSGNVLTDDKLESLDEDKIFSALSIAPPSSLSEDMIPSGGQMPFMIVFTRESAGIFRMVVIPVSE